MSFTCSFHLDLSDGFDEASLLGQIALTDGVNSIHGESVYLDSWFAALLTALRQMRSACPDFAIEIPEHPQALRFCAVEGRTVHVSFRSSEVIASSIDELEQAIQSAVAAFAHEVSKLSGKQYRIPKS